MKSQLTNSTRKLALIVLCSAISVNFLRAQTIKDLDTAPSRLTTLISIPIGAEGVHYKGVGIREMEISGPTSLRIAQDGTFLITDTVAARILRYRSDGSPLEAVKVDAANAVSDVAVTGSSIFALDDSPEEPVVHRLTLDGSALEKTTLPEKLRSEGLSGLTVDDEGAVRGEMRGGAAVVDLFGVERAGKWLAGEHYSVQAPGIKGGSEDRTSGVVVKGQLRIALKVDNAIGGLSVLGVGPDGSLFVLLEEISDTAVLSVDQTVRRYSDDGKLLGVARVPVAERYTYVRNGVAVAPNGQVYALVTRPDRVDVVRLRFSPSLKPILPQGEKTGTQLESGSSGIAASADTEPQTAATTTTCQSRNDMYNIAMSYVNNRTYLSLTNINGSTCTGRGKPRYLGVAGNYGSVSYDWGGYDTPAEFNSYMSQNYAAGDTDDRKIETCSHGVDCSGFVSRAWASGRYTTSSLPGISTEITRSELQRGDIINDAGSHVAMFDRLDPNGVYTVEATAYNSYDRVVNIFNGWSRFNGYRFYRYKSVCGTTTTTPARPVVTSSLRLSSTTAKVGDTLNAYFSITNRGGQSVTFNRLLAGGRMDGDPNCTQGGCPDFSSTGTLTLAPGQSYSYSGSRSFSRAGNYSIFVTYQKTDGSWVSNVDQEGGAINSLRLTVNAAPALALTGHSPTTIYASKYDQTIYLYGTRLTNTSYVYVQFPNGGGGYIYPPGQILSRSYDTLKCKITFGARGQYYLWAYTSDGGWSNSRAVYVY